MTVWMPLTIASIIANFQKQERLYLKHTALSDDETDISAWRQRLLELLNFQLSMRKHIGSSWLNDHYYDFHIQFFKDWEKEHLQEL